jgi:5'-3' exonuclease, N-terminal resolvase-like domain
MGKHSGRTRPPARAGPTGYGPESCVHGDGFAERAAIEPSDGHGKGQRSRAASADKPARSGRPLLVIDGDSFAHRSYHALPKTFRRSDGKAAGAILGFANLLVRLYVDERPREVIVG